MKKRPRKNPLLAEIAELKRALKHYRGRDNENLKKHYPNVSSIISSQIEITTDVRAMELLSEIFAEFIIREMQQNLPSEDRIKEIRNLRLDVFQLFELARAAKTLGNSC